MRSRDRFVSLSLVAVLGGFAVACGGFEKVPDGNVDVSERLVAQQIATKLWSGCRDGHNEALGEAEASKEMREGLTPEKMAATCSSTRTQFGDFVSMDYAETWKPKLGASRVYRFKGHFSKTSSLPEIRVVMEGGKLSGFWLKPWFDMLQ